MFTTNSPGDDMFGRPFRYPGESPSAVKITNRPIQDMFTGYITPDMIGAGLPGSPIYGTWLSDDMGILPIQEIPDYTPLTVDTSPIIDWSNVVTGPEEPASTGVMDWLGNLANSVLPGVLTKAGQHAGIIPQGQVVSPTGTLVAAPVRMPISTTPSTGKTLLIVGGVVLGGLALYLLMGKKR